MGAKRKSVLLILAAGAAACVMSNGGRGQTGTAQPPQSRAVQGSKPMDITPYKLEDDAFWAGSDRGSDKLATQLVGEYSGILIDAPRKVAIDQRQTLPAGVYHLGKVREVATVPFERHGVVTAMNVTENRLYVSSARSFQKDSDPTDEPPPDPAKLSDGDMSTTESIELRQTMKLPWQPAKYLLTVLLRDQMSNRAAVELCQSPSCYVDPEVVKYKEAERARLNPPSVDPSPGTTLPDYRKQPDSPALPDKTGVSLTSTRLIDPRRDQQWLVSGSFRLTALPQELVKPGWSDPYYGPRHSDGKPSAVITIWLLLTGANDGSIYLFPLRVPSFTRGESTFTGHFNFDLRQLRGAPRDPQTYFLYAFSGEHLTGPVPAALVDSRQ